MIKKKTTKKIMMEMVERYAARTGKIWGEGDR
jgi:hypothetical protein